MKLFASLRRHPPSNCRLNLIGLAVVWITLLAAGLAIWDLRQEAIKIYTEEIENLGVAFAEQTSRTLQSVDLVLDQVKDSPPASRRPRNSNSCSPAENGTNTWPTG
jgi:hypothetical protein